MRDLDRPPFLFQPGDGRFHMIYAGALLPAGITVLDSFLAGLGALKARAPDIAARLKVHFVGTGSSPDDPAGHQVRPRAERAGVGDIVDEHPQRVGYVDALNHLGRSDAVLVLGSTETALHAVEGVPGHAVAPSGLRHAAPGQHGRGHGALDAGRQGADAHRRIVAGGWATWRRPCGLSWTTRPTMPTPSIVRPSTPIRHVPRRGRWQRRSISPAKRAAAGRG